MSDTQPLCVEVVHSSPTEAYLLHPTDLELVRPAIEVLTTTPGHLKVYRGLSVEDKQAYAFNVWKDIQAHRDFQNDPEKYPLLKAAIKSFREGPSTMAHINVVSDPFAALSAPTVELAYFTLKSGHSLKALEERVTKIWSILNGLPEKWGCVSATWGPVVETANTFGVIIGWTSVEAHWNTVKTVTELTDLITEILDVAEGSFKHVEPIEWKI